MHILRYLHLRVSELLLLQHHGSQGGDKRGEGTYLGQLFQPFLHSGDLRSQSASQQAEPFPQSLLSQVLVLPREVRQPALLRLWALHYPLPGADRPPGGRTGDGFSPGGGQWRGGIGGGSAEVSSYVCPCGGRCYHGARGEECRESLLARGCNGQGDSSGDAEHQVVARDVR